MSDKDRQAERSEAETEATEATAGSRIGRFSKMNKKQLFFGIAVILALGLFFVANMDNFVAFAKNVLNIIAPLLIGVVIAYLCDPIFEFYEYKAFRRMKNTNLRRGISLTLTVITAFAIVLLILLMMIPNLIDSIRSLVENHQHYLDQFTNFLEEAINWFGSTFHANVNAAQTAAEARAMLVEMFGSVEKIMEQVQNWTVGIDLAGSIGDILMGIFNTFKNVIIGLFIAFYILASKEKRMAQISKFRAAVFTDAQNEKITEFALLTDKCFGGFIYGKIMDSLVIGILTFVLMSIFNISPYNMLIATFVGLTNVIPVFGPFIGAIPSAFIVLISNPSKTLLFIILILIIQQLDGNIIGPKILGDNTGVSSLCVIIAISVCGSIWDIPGMIIGVPLFAVFIEWIKRILESRLLAKGKPTDTSAYYPENAIGNAEKDLYYEHAGMLYEYEHSQFKPRVDRMKKKIFKHLGRQSFPRSSANNTQKNTGKNRSRKK